MITSLDEQARAAGGIKRSFNPTYAQPADIARVVAFLLSDASTHVNGATWTVDAGSSIA